MTSFHFEKNLPHQQQAVNSTVQVFSESEIIPAKGINRHYINPLFNHLSVEPWFYHNIKHIQSSNQISECTASASNIIDIMMETGTGKTYTYSKTIFELNKHYGIFKFVIIVPTLPIKAGTINFLDSASCRAHFKEQYSKSIQLHIVESQKSNKNKKSELPLAIKNFVSANSFDKNNIQVLIINTGMLNSDAMKSQFDSQLLGGLRVPFDAIGATHPFVIIDEPHKFAQNNKTWQNLKKLNAQYILRYGATFPEKTIKHQCPTTHKSKKITVKDYHNLIYQLSAVDAFNQNLVKGVIGHITEFEQGKNSLVKLVNTDGKEASFELIDDNKTTNIKLINKDSLSKIHKDMQNLTIERLNKSAVVLSNGLVIKKGDKITPYSYAQTLQEVMLEKTVKQHFQLEKELLNREVKIKPLTLFFIDNIDIYRGEHAYLKTKLEILIQAEISRLLKQKQSKFYQHYLQQTLNDLSATHGGYFSKDNSEKDDKIEQQINEILHDKEALLDLNNTRRFIFSKWTLREGWDNPNIFQICKLRSSGSDISKLQEVGRGLRLPVNEYGNRVKNEPFYLHYFVDFTETDFIDKLVAEINQGSESISAQTSAKKLEVNKVVNNKLVSEKLPNKELVNEEMFSKKELNKQSKHIAQNTSPKHKPTLKQPAKNTYKQNTLKQELADEMVFQKFLTDFFIEQFNSKVTRLNSADMTTRSASIKIHNQQAMINNEYEVLTDNHSTTTTKVATMKYSDFLIQLASHLKVNLKTLHHALIASKVNINPLLNPATIRHLHHHFEEYLLNRNIANSTA